ncbi:hypothetical protein B0A71_12895 [Flavobacterium tructae]|uniref:Uncharacterized protein n=1 Tax=Flavobacterium tructae TaxID=1114873 RepID=A0A1S1J804_9FLAO|nr:hypothetical protein BHE19_11980 [Flavobacterium tructae]OXB19431.1 hypothetical protein B0A71_12895 [Flavobacterium tructae]
MIKNILNYFKKRKERKKAQKETIHRVINNYNELINELRLIQEKKSKLSKKERDFVELRIMHLISKGHIQVST